MLKASPGGIDPNVTIGQIRTFLYGTLVVLIDLLARPLFALLHHNPRRHT